MTFLWLLGILKGVYYTKHTTLPFQDSVFHTYILWFQMLYHIAICHIHKCLIPLGSLVKPVRNFFFKQILLMQLNLS